MSKIIKTDAQGAITFTYDVVPTLVNHPVDVSEDTQPYTVPMFVTSVSVQTYWDGDVSVTVRAVEMTKTGQPHKGRTPQVLWLDDDVVAALMRDLGIDATAMPVIRDLARGPQDEEV